MIHLNNEYVDVKKVCRYKRGVRFENPVDSNVVPEGYMTSEEFRKRAFEKVNKFCNKHGIL